MKRVIFLSCALFCFMFMTAQSANAQIALNKEVMSDIVSDVYAGDGAHIVWKVKETTIYDGYCEIVVAFINDGDMAAELTKAEITLYVTYNGNLLFKITKTFDMNNMYVWNGAPQHTFRIWDSRFKSEMKFNGKTPYSGHLDYYTWWNNRTPIGM